MQLDEKRTREEVVGSKRSSLRSGNCERQHNHLCDIEAQRRQRVQSTNLLRTYMVQIQTFALR